MKITVNGEIVDVESDTLEAVLQELGHSISRVATAVNEEFVPAAKRSQCRLNPGDRIEILTPRHGG